MCLEPCCRPNVGFRTFFLLTAMIKRDAVCASFHQQISVVVILITDRAALGIGRTRQPFQRIVNEAACLAGLIDSDQVIERVITVASKVILIRIVRSFVNLNQTAERIGDALPLLARLIADGHRVAAV